MKAGERGKPPLLDEADFEIEWCKKWLPQEASGGRAPRGRREGRQRAARRSIRRWPASIIGTDQAQFGDRADAQLVKKLADELLK